MAYVRRQVIKSSTRRVKKKGGCVTRVRVPSHTKRVKRKKP